MAKYVVEINERSSTAKALKVLLQNHKDIKFMTLEKHEEMLDQALVKIMKKERTGQLVERTEIMKLLNS